MRLLRPSRLNPRLSRMILREFQELLPVLMDPVRHLNKLCAWLNPTAPERHSTHCMEWSLLQRCILNDTIMVCRSSIPFNIACLCMVWLNVP